MNPLSPDTALAWESHQPDDPSAAVERVRSHFVVLHDHEPHGVYAAPGRVNLVGEHTDYNQGLCLPIALPYATYAAVEARDDDLVTITSLQQRGEFRASVRRLGPGNVSGWAAYAAGVIWALNQEGVKTPGLDLVVHGRVPLGAGLSSSASLECAVALAVCGLAGVELDEALRRHLIHVCGRAEHEVAGAPTGGLDQAASLLARDGHALLLDCRDWSVEHVPWDPSAHSLELIVVDTRATHALADGSYGSRRDQCHQAAAELGLGSLRAATGLDLRRLTDPVLLRRARHVVSEIDRVRQAAAALRADDYAALGGIFSASHASLRDDFEVSCAELDVVCQASADAGALGSRMTGGGFGGSAIVLTPAGSADAVRGAVVTAFAERGWRGPRFLIGTAAAGAHQVPPAGSR